VNLDEENLLIAFCLTTSARKSDQKAPTARNLPPVCQRRFVSATYDVSMLVSTYLEKCCRSADGPFSIDVFSYRVKTASTVSLWYYSGRLEPDSNLYVVTGNSDSDFSWRASVCRDDY
jgi:hypothetical protein